MASILKVSEYQGDAVVVSGNGRRRFTPTHYGETGSEEAEQPDEATLQRHALETARGQAERVLAEAEAEAATAKREAMVRGYQEGMAEGLRISTEQAREHLARLAELSRRALFDREAMIRAAQPELAALALAIAARVIHREVASDPTVVLCIVRAALEKVPSEESVRLLVHPDDVELVRAKGSELGGAAGFGVDWEVVGDDRMQKGGCFIKMKGGVVDGRIEAQLGRVAASFEADG